MPSFAVSIAILSLVQAALVALPRARRFAWLDAFRSPWWALVPALSIVVVIGIVGLGGRIGDRALLAGAGRGAALRSAGAGLAGARLPAGVGGGGRAAVRRSPGRAPGSLARRGRGDGADRARLHRARLAAGLGGAGVLAEAGDLRDGRGRHLVRRHRPAPGPQRDPHRRGAQRPTAPAGRPLRRRR